MLRLPSFEPRWLDLPRGVRVHFRPATQGDIAAAGAWARGEAVKAEEAQAAALPGLEATEASRQSLVNGFRVLALARLCVDAWEGVDRECSPAAVDDLMRLPGYGDLFFEAAVSPMLALDAEGNASAPAPNGIMAGAPDTAMPAEPGA